MIDTSGKIFERIICDRIEKHLEEVEGLSDYQYGFRRRRSTIDAIKKLTEIAGKAVEGTRWLYGSKEYCAVVTLDVKNAFNFACWAHTTLALEILYDGILRLLMTKEVKIIGYADDIAVKIVAKELHQIERICNWQGK